MGLNWFIGVFPKWAELSGNSVNSGNLINHWNMNCSLDPVSSMLVSYTGDDKFEPFYCNDKYFVAEFDEVSETFRKNSTE